MPGKKKPEVTVTKKGVVDEPQAVVTPKATPDTSVTYHEVKSGETLWSISQKYYNAGNKYKKIVDANSKIVSGDKIYPGQRLVIPE